MKRHHPLLFMIVSITLIQLAAAVDVTSTAFRCSACRAIADSLADRLLNEKPRNHLDVRHRLDKDGNRYGKVIEFSVSELRTIELLDGICDSIKSSYELAWSRQAVESLHARSDSDVYWAKKNTAKGDYKRDIPSHQGVEERRFLQNFCDGFIEKYEDDIVGKIIRGGSVDIGEFEDLLCGGEISKYCSGKAGEDPWLPLETTTEEETNGDGSSGDDVLHVEL